MCWLDIITKFSKKTLLWPYIRAPAILIWVVTLGWEAINQQTIKSGLYE